MSMHLGFCLDHLPDALTLKRMTRSSLCLTGCVGLALADPTAAFLGPNIFLIGTTAIYLYPKSTVGSQVTSTFIGYLGFLLGLAWYNVFIHISVHLPSPGDRIWIFIAFITGAWLCGYVRSRYPVCYLGMNFFMLVNIFGLIVAIETENHDIRSFTDFFYVFTFGSIIALICVLLWPENTATNLERRLLAIFIAIQSLARDKQMHECDQTASCASLKSAHRSLQQMLTTSRIEVLFSRLVPDTFEGLLLSSERIIDSMCMLHRNTSTLQEESPAYLSQRCDEFQGICQKLRSLQVYQCQTIVEQMRYVTEGTSASDDLEKAKCTTGDQNPVSSVDRIAHVKATIALWPAEGCNLEIRWGNIMRTSLLITLELQGIVLETAHFREISHGRRRLHLPAACNRARKEDDKFEQGSRGLESFSTPDAEGSVSRAKLWPYVVAHKVTKMRDSRHTQYAFKFQFVMGILSIFPFISDWRVWYADVRGHWALVFAMVVMEITRGLLIRSALMKAVGSLCGGLLAAIIYTLGTLGDQKNVALMTCLTFPCAMGIYNIALNPRVGKAGMVAALAYNLVLGTGYVTEQPWLAYLKRTATQLVGILVACVVTVLISPYHARREIKLEICSGIDELAASYHECARGEYATVRAIPRTKTRLFYAQELLKLTKYEPSLKGGFPREVFGEIIDDILVLVDQLSNLQKVSEHNEIGLALPNPALTRAHSSAARDLYLVSHALASKSNAINLLASTLEEGLSGDCGSAGDKIPAAHKVAIQEMSVVINRLRRTTYRIISGRSLPGLIAQSKSVSPMMHVSTKGSQPHSFPSNVSPLGSLTLGAKLLAPAPIVSATASPRSTSPSRRDAAS